MEDTRDSLQNFRNEIKKSTGRQYGGSHSSTTMHTSSGHNSQTNTLIEYDNDETLEIKEEFILDQERQQNGSHNLLPDKNHLGEKSICSDNNFGAAILTQYDNDETLEIKQEIIQDQEIHQSADHNLLSDQTHREENSASCGNNSGCRTLIEYDNDETLEIKEEVVQDRENTGQTCNKKYKLKVSTVDISAADTFPGKNYQCTLMKQKMQESKQDKEEKIETSRLRYNCTKCRQSYITKWGLINHERLEHTAVKPQFICDVCGYRAKRKYHLSRHTSVRHFKMSTASQARHNCDKCFKSYVSLATLYVHNRLKHAAIKPEFICDICGYKSSRKHDLSRHISSRHFKTSMTSQTRHNCDKCSRSYSLSKNLYRHNRLEHAAVKPQLICDACGYKTNRKESLSSHISLRHFNKSTTLQATHRCVK